MLAEVVEVGLEGGQFLFPFEVVAGVHAARGGGAVVEVANFAFDGEDDVFAGERLAREEAQVVAIAQLLQRRAVVGVLVKVHGESFRFAGSERHGTARLR